MKCKYGAWADRKTEVHRAKPAPVPFGTPQANEWTLASTARGHHVTISAMAQSVGDTELQSTRVW